MSVLMGKCRTVANVSCILDRGMGTNDETSYFAEKSHDNLVEEFRDYLEKHRPLISYHVEITQALNDRGTDLILQGDDCKLGFQIKSHYDVTEKEFATNVKRQQTESLAHGLDKWYLLICSPLQFLGQDFSQRIQHLLNEISSYKTDYIEVYSPRNAIKYFNNSLPLPEEEFTKKIRPLTYDIQVNFSARYIKSCSNGEFYELQIIVSNHGSQTINQCKLEFNFPDLAMIDIPSFNKPARPVGYVQVNTQNTEALLIRKQDSHYRVIYHSMFPLFAGDLFDIGKEIGFQYCSFPDFRGSQELAVRWKLYANDGIQLKGETTIYGLYQSSQ